MRQPLLILLLVFASFGVAHADDRADARTHYQAGVKSYSTGDYRTAIKEFGAAQQLVPADLNNYNLALCYDKLGEAEPAIQYYKEYLNKVPDAPKHSEIEASIARLDGALKSQSAKKADEQKKIDDAKRAEDAKKAADDAKKAEDARKASDDAKHAPIGPVGPPDVTPPPTGVGSTGTPSTGLTVSTGDSQLDKVSAIDINAIRDQRVGGASSGLPDRAGGPATNPAAGGMGAPPNGGPQPNGMAGTPPNANAGAGPNNNLQPTDKPAAPQETPVYKKWWFWVVVGVTAFVIIDIAASGSNNNNQPTVGRLNNRETLPLNSPGAGFNSGGYTLLHF